MKVIKQLTICLVLFVCIVFPSMQTNAETIRSSYTEPIYCVTVIEQEPVVTTSPYSTTKTKTASKTVYYQDANNNKLWYVKVTATFSYNGSTSSCKSASVTAGSYSSDWKVSNTNSSYSGNHGTASATGKKYFSGHVMSTINRSVTLTCSKDGTLS